MKLTPTASQTVGPFFSIGMAALYQKKAAFEAIPDNAITLQGTLFDADGSPIPDALLELWSAASFIRVPTMEDGSFQAILEPLVGSNYLDVLIFMRGLLRPVYTRCYFAGLDQLRNEPFLRSIPDDRLSTLLAHPDSSPPNPYKWDIYMQGPKETVFFDL